MFAIPLRVPYQAEARLEGIVIRVRVAVGDAGIACEQRTGWGIRILTGSLSLGEGYDRSDSRDRIGPASERKAPNESRPSTALRAVASLFPAA